MFRLSRGLLLVALVGLAPVAAAADPASSESSFIVSFHAWPEGLDVGARLGGGRVTLADPALGFALVEMSSARAERLAADARVAALEPDGVMTTQLAPDDARFAEQYAPAQMRLPEAWDVTTGSSAVSICVVDTGVRYTHEEFAGRWLGGHDFVERDADPMDDNGHGTHVAGIAAAAIGNGAGIAGVAQVGLYGVKVLDAKGRGATSTVASGVRWCADQGADVVSLSLGGSGSSALRSAVKYAWQKGSLVVAAAGNNGPCTDCIRYPAAYPEAMAVTCTDAQEALCGFSSTGAPASVAAPGRSILSASHEGDAAYRSLSGTSMSAPQVAGVAALLWSAAPHLTNAEVRAALERTARDAGAPGRDAQFGFGIVDARAALRAVAPGTAPEPASADPAPEPAPTEPAPAEPTPAPAPIPSPPLTNVPPVAVAGEDQRIVDTRGLGIVFARLDGSASHDPDGRIVAWAWRDASGKLLSTYSRAFAVLSPGSHTMTLEVTDAKGATTRDEIVVEVVRA